MSDEVKHRVEALRRQRKEFENKRDAARAAADNKKKDELLTWEAEIVLALEDYTDKRIINEISDDMDIYEYLSTLLNIMNINIQLLLMNSHYSNAYIIKSMVTSNSHERNVFKLKYLLNHINYIKVYPEYIIKEITRTQKIAEEKRILKQKEDHEESIRRQQILDETNINIKDLLRNYIDHTFTELTLEDWDDTLISKKSFLAKTGESEWTHYTIDIYNKRVSQYYNGMPPTIVELPEFSSYYQEGKVPFFTNCPTCNSPTKFNYIYNIYGVGTEGFRREKTNSFKEVYCDGHYFYNTRNTTHYKSDTNGSPIIIEYFTPPYTAQISGITYYPEQPKWGDWSPKGNWSIWDPSDPHGAKAAAEKKRKEAEEIQKQIAELQAKLTALQS